MKIFAICAFVILASAGAWIAARQVGYHSVSQPARSAGSNTFRFDENSPATRDLMLSAVNGSPVSATRLMDMYGHCDKMEWNTNDQLRKCSNSLHYWMQIALQNGSPSAAQTYSAFLLESKSCVDIYRAEYWFNKYKSHFAFDGRFIKSVWNEIQDNKKTCVWKTP